jgi:Domain of Unknown Function (DUF928)
MTQLKQTISLTIALLLTLSNSFPGQAQSVPTVLPNANDPIDPIIFNSPPDPPSTGQPGRRSDAGSRGCGGDESSNSSEPKPLLALVPIQETADSTVVFGKTAAERPTFWFYIPPGNSLTATFVLQDRDGNPIYESDVALPQTAGILSFTLPATAAPLEAGKPYHWFFKLYCQSKPPPSFVEGWIQREALPPDLTGQLETATPQQQVRLYAANGFWFEALTLAAQLRRTNSEDSAWAELLKAIGLESVVDEAIATP